jgi:hypothetical protein
LTGDFLKRHLRQRHAHAPIVARSQTQSAWDVVVVQGVRFTSLVKIVPAVEGRVRNADLSALLHRGRARVEEVEMNNIIYIVGLIVVVMVILSFFGLR